MDKYFSPLKNDSNEAGSIIKHAFRMYSDILYMPTAINKFIQAMSLIEYIANLFEYEQMKKAKTKIIPFSSDSKKDYFNKYERFKYLTSLEVETGKQIGLRTSIIHNGKNLEELLDKGYKIDLLLRELQMYICNFINSIIIFSNRDWDFVKTKVAEFSKIIWISDRNTIPDEDFQRAEQSCKKVISGRLDNKRTTCYDVCTWWEIFRCIK